MFQEKEYRPRFSDVEIRFLIAVLDQQRREFKQQEKKREILKLEVKRLRRLFVRTGSFDVFKELQETKQQLEIVTKQSRYIFRRSLFCNALCNRFKAILEGTHKHRPQWLYKSPEVAVPIHV